jgi:hypothetical protein
MRKIRGTAIAYALAIMTVVMILLTSILTFIASQLQYSFKQNDKEQALQIAEGGVHFYKWYLAHQLDGRTAGQVNAFWDAGTALGQTSDYVANFENGQYSIHVTPPDPSQTIVYIESTGWTTANPDMTRTIRVRLRRPSWSEDAVMSNEAVRFGEGTEVFGPMHSNNGIRFDGLAHNLITSSVDAYNDADHTGANEFGVHTHKNVPPATGITSSFRAAEAPASAVAERLDVFEAGREFPVAPVDFNGVLGDLSLMKSEAQAGTNGSRYFNNVHQGRHIILKTNDTFDIRTVQSFNATTNEINNYTGGWANYAIPDDGVIFVENNVWVEGTVSGRRVTVVAANLISASQKTLYVGKDIRYTNYDCTDMIGLIGQNDVEVYRQSNNVLRLDASLLAQTGRVGRANYTGGFAIRSTITVYGAIASNERYGFAWADAMGNHVSGYQTRNLYYDNNLLYCPPPYFPTGSQYTLDLWEEL